MELFFLCATVALVIQAVWLTCRALRGDRVNSVDYKERHLLIAVVASTHIWAILPATAAIITGKYDIFNFGLPLRAWTFGLVLELILILFFMVGYFYGPRDHFRRLALTLRRTPNSEHLIAGLLVGAAGIYLALYGPWSKAGYEAAGAYVNTSLTDPSNTFGGMQETIFLSVLVPMSVVILFAAKNVSRLLKGVAAAVFVYVVLDTVASGVRGRWLGLALCIAVCQIVHGRMRRAIAYFAVAGLLVAWLSGAIINYRQNSARYADESITARAGHFFDAVMGQRPASGPWAEEYLIRLDTTQNGGSLADHARISANFAGFRPFYGAAVAFIPRFLWKDKPLPLSGDNTVPGLPWYMVMGFRGEPWNNGSVSASGIAYWQFGWLGVLVTGLLAGVAFRGISIIAMEGGALGVLLFLIIPMNTHFQIPIAMDQLLLVLVQLVGPLLLAMLTFGFLFRNGSVRPALVHRPETPFATPGQLFVTKRNMAPRLLNRIGQHRVVRVVREPGQ